MPRIADARSRADLRVTRAGCRWRVGVVRLLLHGRACCDGRTRMPISGLVVTLDAVTRAEARAPSELLATRASRWAATREERWLPVVDRDGDARRRARRSRESR